MTVELAACNEQSMTAFPYATISGPISFCDVTLRDGEQASDAAFTIDEKAEIVGLLTELGLDSIQVGVCGSGDATVIAAKERGSSASLELLALITGDDWQDRLDRSIRAGVDELHLFLKASEANLSIAGMSADETVRRVEEALDFVVGSRGVRAMVGVSYATQTDPRFLQRIYQAAETGGAVRVGVSDSVGVASPNGMKWLVMRVREMTSLPVLVHCHNDFGLATACTLAALEGGATWCDVTVCGLGERAGNTSLEQVALALSHLYRAKVGVHTEQLGAVAARVAAVLRRPLPPDQPVVGRDVFAAKVDSHVRAALTDPSIHEAFDPGEVGNRRSIRLGKGSGPYAVGHKLQTLGVELSADDLAGLITAVNAYAESHKRALDDADFLTLLHDRGINASMP